MIPEVRRSATVDAPLLRRRTSLKSFGGLYVALAALAAAVWIAAFSSDQLAAHRPITLLAGLVPLVAAVVYGCLVRLNTEYRLFQDLLEVESGIVSRRIENIQLFRVRDLGLQQSMLNRLAGVGDVIVTSTDQSAPHFRLRGVEDPRALYEQLRDLVSRSQAVRRTMIVEQER
jgi:uncharacterized membrane protein YdbT with pleckstrin-like domain